MSTETSLISSAAAVLPVFTLTAEATQLKESALTSAALIGKVENAEENALAVNAQKELKRIQNLFEKERKKLNEPILEAKRQLDRTVSAALVEVEKESGRLQNLTSEFQLAEQRRIREEEELQRKEVEVINSNPTLTEEQKSDAVYAASRPIQATRVTGQVVKTDWEIIVTNPYELAKFHPDCVKIEPILTAIKAALNEGREVKGVKAQKKTTASVRAGLPQRAIDV